jgi:hypothetical protein
MWSILAVVLLTRSALMQMRSARHVASAEASASLCAPNGRATTERRRHCFRCDRDTYGV